VGCPAAHDADAHDPDAADAREGGFRRRLGARLCCDGKRGKCEPRTVLGDQPKAGKIVGGDRRLIRDGRGRGRKVAREARFPGLERGYGKMPKRRHGVQAAKNAPGLAIEREHPMRSHDGGRCKRPSLRSRPSSTASRLSRTPVLERSLEVDPTRSQFHREVLALFAVRNTPTGRRVLLDATP
jgi:hypothetical protein